MQFRHQLRRELAPVVGRAVGALYVQRAHVRGMGLGDDRGDAPSARFAHVPDPHSLARERRPRRPRRRRPARTPWRRRGRVKRGAEHVDRPVGAGVAGAAQQHHDLPGVRLLGDRHDQARAGGVQPPARRSRADARAGGARKRHDHPRLQALALHQQGPVRGHLMRVGAASRGRHAADPHDADRGDVRARGAGRRGRRSGPGVGASGERGRLVPAAVRGRSGAPPAPAAAVPPGLTARAAPGWPPKAHTSSATTETEANVRRLWALVLAKRTPSRRKTIAPLGGRDLSRCACANRTAGRKLRQLQRNPSGAGDGASGLDGRPAGGSGRLKPVGATSLGASA